MLPEEMQYILYRKKSQGYFANGVPYEYPTSKIREDMKKAGWIDPPSEAEIRDFLDIKKTSLKERVLDMARSGKEVADIRLWCEYSLDCPIPISPLSQVSAESILSRYDYFNFEVSRMIREEQVDILIAKRREMGPDTDVKEVLKEQERTGLMNLQDEITRPNFYSEGDLLRVLMDLEDEALLDIKEYTREGMSTQDILRKASERRSPIFTEAELPDIVEINVRKYRFSIIATSIRAMPVSDIWNFIDSVKAVQALKTSDDDISVIATKIGLDPALLQSVREYQKGREVDPEDPYLQLSMLTTRDCIQLLRLLRGYITWRGMFHFIRPDGKPSNGQEFMRKIVEGYSEDNGFDPSLFELFLY